jgi:hypothetical protein
MLLAWWYPQFWSGWRVGNACLYVLALFHHISAGEGRLLAICDVDSPPAYPVMTNMNFKKHIFTLVLSSLNWATVQEDYTPGELN